MLTDHQDMLFILHLIVSEVPKLIIYAFCLLAFVVVSAISTSVSVLLHRHIWQHISKEKKHQEEEGNNKQRLSGDEVEVPQEMLFNVMEKLGIANDSEMSEKQPKLTSGDFCKLFEQEEPTFKEVEDAFLIFDKNKDGYIDTDDLKLLLSTLCSNDFSEAECNNMIRRFDTNGDGLVDVKEFTRLLEQSFE